MDKMAILHPYLWCYNLLPRPRSSFRSNLGRFIASRLWVYDSRLFITFALGMNKKKPQTATPKRRIFTFKEQILLATLAITTLVRQEQRRTYCPRQNEKNVSALLKAEMYLSPRKTLQTVKRCHIKHTWTNSLTGERREKILPKKFPDFHMHHPLFHIAAQTMKTKGLRVRCWSLWSVFWEHLSYNWNSPGAHHQTWRRCTGVEAARVSGGGELLRHASLA